MLCVSSEGKILPQGSGLVGLPEDASSLSMGCSPGGSHN